MSSLVVPAGYRLHSENDTHILLGENDAFLNPVQEFNRDLSVAAIRVWSEENDRMKKEKALSKSRNRNSAKRHKVTEEGQSSADSVSVTQSSTIPTGSGPSSHKITILEPLSATGLRSIRFAKEIPLVKRVVANDLSPDAIQAIRRNVEFNGLSSDSGSQASTIQINQGDACTLMYAHRDIPKRVDVIDLDPYGTVAPFIDSAVQAVSDGGLLCVTCTDLAVLATTNYPEKSYSNYGGIPMKAEYCHEGALRLVLHAISTSASRYGRYILPLLSLSIDFYVRLFIKVGSQPIEVKKAIGKTAVYYVCTFCQTPYEQPIGKVIEKVHESSGNVNVQCKTHAGPGLPEKCRECGSNLHLAGPMWSGPIHDQAFVNKVLEEVEQNAGKYGTAPRMKGMLTVAREELLDAPFYFTPGKISAFFHCNTPSLDEISSALLHAGHRVSRSHACPGSLKTDASRARVYDIMRSWIKRNPVRIDKLAEGSPTRILLQGGEEFEANFESHPATASMSSKIKLVRYQNTPENWGPGKKATGTKRKRGSNETP